jgi:hypothetical protein
VTYLVLLRLVVTSFNIYVLCLARMFIMTCMHLLSTKKWPLESNGNMEIIVSRSKEHIARYSRISLFQISMATAFSTGMASGLVKFLYSNYSDGLLNSGEF